MPHWRESQKLICIKGTWGAAAPIELTPLESEKIIQKSFFSGFETGELDGYLKGLQVDDLVIAGLYTHACVRSTALDAYAKGYSVNIALDAIASPEPLHAEITRGYLEKRGIPFVRTDAILKRQGLRPDEKGSKTESDRSDQDGQRQSTNHPEGEKQLYDPYASDELKDIDAVISSLSDPWGKWMNLSIRDRANFLERWHDALLAERDHWISDIVKEIGKPLRDAQEEFHRAMASITAALEVGRLPNETGHGFEVCYRPLGTIAIITPWNNPIAIPIGKIVPALLFGNAIVWKPSPYANRIAGLLADSLYQAGIPTGLVQILPGGAELVRELIRHPKVSAVSLTGSQNTGRTVAAICNAYAKPLQAELGGNNAVIVRPDADLATVVPGLVKSAFGFSGQRCTAIRRFIVDRSIAKPFIRFFKEETEKLVQAMPQDIQCDIGPLISEKHRQTVDSKVRNAIQKGANCVFTAETPELPLSNRWYPPTILQTDDNLSEIVQQETFGPVAVIQIAEDLIDGIRLANEVRQGLVAGLIGGTTEDKAIFLERAQAGILNVGNPIMSLDMRAPFCGWKESAIGTPEHGRWDREFFSRVQVVYRKD